LALMKLVALVADLMDRSKLAAAIPEIELVRQVDAAGGADVIVVDLARYADQVAALRRIAPNARIIAFGPHVDEAGLAAARADGADLVLPRSRFFHDPAGAVAGTP
jgi:hypothetical protein